MWQSFKLRRHFNSVNYIMWRIIISCMNKNKVWVPSNGLLLLRENVGLFVLLWGGGQGGVMTQQFFKLIFPSEIMSLWECALWCLLGKSSSLVLSGLSSVCFLLLLYRSNTCSVLLLRYLFTSYSSLINCLLFLHLPPSFTISIDLMTSCDSSSAWATCWYGSGQVYKTTFPSLPHPPSKKKERK